MPGNDWLSDQETWLSALVWLGLVLLFAGARLRRRRLAMGGAACLAVGCGVAPVERSVEFVETRLDEAMPRFQFREWHYRHVRAPQHVVYGAMKELGAEPAVAWLWRQFRVVEEAEGCEIVLGRRVAAGAEATIHFLLEPTNRRTTVISTETRVFGEGWRVRAFAMYWRVIYPGSALLRVWMLGAVQGRAMRTVRGTGAS